jgi:peptidoglycan hydrolase CwlO-like protein
MYKQRPMKYISILSVILATISCSVNPKVEDKGIDTIVIEKQDTLFIDTLKKKSKCQKSVQSQVRELSKMERKLDRLKKKLKERKRKRRDSQSY